MTAPDHACRMRLREELWERHRPAFVGLRRRPHQLSVDLGTVTVDKHTDAEIPGPKSFDMVPVEIPADWMPNVSDPRQLRTLVAVPTDSPHTSVAPMEDRAAARQQHADTVATWLHQQHTETGRVPGRETARKWAKENGVLLGNDVLADLIRTVKKEIEEP